MKKPVPYNAKDFVSADTGLVLSLGETIRTLREISELTQKALVLEAGIPQTTISAIESVRTKLGAERATVFARVFNVHPAVILFSDWRRAAA